MKKILLIISLLLLLSCQSMAQVFTQKDRQELFNREGENPGHGGDNVSPDPPVTPIGSGLLVLTGLSIGYACFKRNRKEDWKIFEYYKMGWFAISIFLFFKNFSLIIK